MGTNVQTKPVEHDVPTIVNALLEGCKACQRDSAAELAERNLEIKESLETEHDEDSRTSISMSSSMGCSNLSKNKEVARAFGNYLDTFVSGGVNDEKMLLVETDEGMRLVILYEEGYMYGEPIVAVAIVDHLSKSVAQLGFAAVSLVSKDTALGELLSTCEIGSEVELYDKDLECHPGEVAKVLFSPKSGAFVH